MKKFLCVALSVIMLLLATPFVALAADDAVCYIGTTPYATLQDAVTNVANGETITLASDISLTSSITVPNKDLTFTIDGTSGTGRYTITGNKYITANAGVANINFTNVNIVSTLTGMKFDPNTTLKASDGATELTGTVTRTYNFTNCKIDFADLGFKLSGAGATNLTKYVLNFTGCELTQEPRERLFFILSANGVEVNLVDTDIKQISRDSGNDRNLIFVENNATNVKFTLDKDSSVSAAPTTTYNDNKYTNQSIFFVNGTSEDSFALELANGASLYVGGPLTDASYGFISAPNGATVGVVDNGATWKADKTAVNVGVTLPTLKRDGATFYGWIVDDGLYLNTYKNENATGDVVITPVFYTNSDFDMIDGAAIRYSDDGGIRFTTYTKSSFREGLNGKAVFGTLIAPSALLEGELTIESATEGDFANIVTNRWTINEEGMPVYHAALIGFPDTTAAYRTNFAARAYMIITYDDNATATYYTDFDENNVRSPYKVADILYNRDEDPIKDNKYINHVLDYALNCNPCYKLDFKSGTETYHRCKFCGELTNIPASIDISSGKYADSFDLFVQGSDIDVTYTFTNIPGSNGAWHNFIMDIQPAVMLSDGTIYDLYTTTSSKFPIFPYYSYEDYYAGSKDNGQGKHESGFKAGYGVTHTFLGTYGLLMADGSDITDYTSFKNYMLEGLDVTVRITREEYGALKMVVDYVTRTTKCYGKIDVNYGFEGVKQFNFRISGESCTLTDFAAKVTKGEVCTVDAGTSIIDKYSNCSGTVQSDGSIVLDNNGQKDVQNIEYRLKGDYEVEMQFTMSSTTAMDSANGNGWHTWLLNLFAYDGSKYDGSWMLVGNGIEVGTLNHGHSSDFWDAWKLSAAFETGYDKRSAIYDATITVRVARCNGYTTVFGVAEKDGVVTALYSFYSKDLTFEGTLWDGGYNDYPTTLHLTSESSAVTLEKINLISGEYYIQ